MDEFVDIVDPQNNVVSQSSKREAHAKGLLHRCIIAEVISSDKKWGLVKQAGDRQDPGQYVSPVGGHVQAGEDEVSALKREALEELGLRDFKYKRVGQSVFKRTVNNRIENHFFIVYEIYTDALVTLNEESVAFKKFTKGELSKMLHDSPDSFGGAFHFVVEKFYPQLLNYEQS